MDRGVRWAIVHGVAESWTRLSKCVRTHTQSGILQSLTTDLVNADLPLPGEMRAGVLHASDHSIFI